jgi:hypothetical protein
MDNFEILAQPLTHSTRPLRETSETFFDAKDYIEDSRGELQRLQDENEDLRKKWTDACANLADIQSVVSYKLDDGHFMSEWKLLQKLIHEWGATHFSNRMPIAQYGTRLVISAKKLQNLGRHWKHYAGSNERRPLLAQAVLWGFLQSDVFAFPFGNLSIGPGMRGAYWAHPYQTDIAHLNERLRDGGSLLLILL